jgi:outer membrane protein OmpA-like peptidoglycan-associated protein
MIRFQPRLASAGVLSFIVLISLGTIASAQTTKVQGVIKARSGPALTLQTSDNENVEVLLTDITEVQQSQGLFRRKEMSMAALIPGLPVDVEGIYNGQRQLVAKSVKFKGDELEQAKAIQAGMHETAQQTQQNTAELEKQNTALEAQNQALKQQQADLEKQQADLKQQQADLLAQQQKLAANRAAIQAAVARFGQLDDYYIFDQVTVYFGNGKVDLDPKYKPDLVQLAEKAKAINGFMIEVKGYASSAGSVALNQKLSQDRAANVANFMLQDGHIPLTSMLAPGAMGESQQVGEDKTAEGQAENRRVVVRVLQNKGVAGF